MKINLNNLKKHKYLILFMCMFLQAIPFAIAQSIQPLFISYVTKGEGFSLGSFSLLFTIGAVVAAICSPSIGKLYANLNIKIVFTLGCIVSGLGFLGFAFAKSLSMYYVFSAICQIGTVTFSALGVPLLINSWFPKHERGKALGLAFSGGSIGNIFLQKIVSQALATQGYSKTYFIFGVVSLLVSIPIALFFVRLPKKDEVAIESTGNNNNSLEEGIGIKGVTKNKFFWTFAIGYLIIGSSISALSIQYATYFANGLGFSPSLIGTIGSFFAFFCLLGNVTGGILFDKLGVFKTMLIAGSLELVACIALVLSGKFNMLAFVFAMAYGLNVYAYMCAPAFITQDLFGKKDSSQILGITNLLFAVGFASGSTIFGVMVDKVGYSIAWNINIIYIVFGYIILLFSIKKIKNANKKESVKIKKNLVSA